MYTVLCYIVMLDSVSKLPCIVYSAMLTCYYRSCMLTMFYSVMLARVVRPFCESVMVEWYTVCYVSSFMLDVVLYY